MTTVSEQRRRVKERAETLEGMASALREMARMLEGMASRLELERLEVEEEDGEEERFPRGL